MPDGRHFEKKALARGSLILILQSLKGGAALYIYNSNGIACISHGTLLPCRMSGLGDRVAGQVAKHPVTPRETPSVLGCLRVVRNTAGTRWANEHEFTGIMFVCASE